MSDPPEAPLFADPVELAALDLPDAHRAGVIENLRLLAEHWRRFADREA